MTQDANEITVSAEILTPLKEALIKIGYATEDTPLEFVQDAYFKYVMVRQTGFSPSLPYAIGLLPKELQDQLGIEEAVAFA